MLKLNKKGQASSTFQLLIAAIVALAILGVLISVIGGIPGISTDPKNATKDLLNKQKANYGAESCTEKVAFSKTTPSLAAMGITDGTGLESDQLIFSNPEGISSFVPEDGTTSSILKYDSQQKKEVRMCIICAEGVGDEDSGLTKALEDNDIEGITLSSADIGIDGETLCIAYPKKV